MIARWIGAPALALCLLPLAAWPAPPAKPSRYLAIQSTPPGATVFLDDPAGKPVGITPVKRLKVEEGFHEFIFVLKGHRTEKVALNVDRTTKTVQASLRAVALVQISAGSSEAEGARLLIDGKEAGTVPYNGEVDPGRHQFEVVKEGYRPLSQWVELAGGQIFALPVLLISEKKPVGSVFITADVSGVPVFIDGAAKGQTPMTIDLPPGPALIELRPTEGAPWKKTVQVAAGEKLIVEAQVMPKSGPSGTLVVLSNIPGTLISINGTKTGTAPVTVPGLPVGTHIIEGRAQGFQPYQSTVRVADKEQTVVQVELKPIEAEFGRISVRSAVPGSVVYVDGGERGLAPVELDRVPLGPHAIIVRGKGFEDFETSCLVKRNEVCNVMAEPVQLASIKVTSNAAGATLAIDDREMGPLPFEGTVRAGKHTLRVRARDFKERTEEVSLQASPDVRLLDFALESAGTSAAEVAAKQEKDLATRQELYKGASSMTGVPLGPGQNAVDVGLGLPYLFEGRGTVGLFDKLAVGVGLRFLERDKKLGFAELQLRGHTGVRPIKPFSVGAQLEVGAGFNFRNINTLSAALSALASLHFAQAGAFTLSLTGEILHDSWDGVGNIDGNAKGSQTPKRLRGAATMLFWASEQVAVWAGLEYLLAGDDRLVYRELFFGVFDDDPQLYFHAGGSVAF